MSDHLTHCYACQKGLRPEHGSEEEALRHEHWENALVIAMEGGYGMFIDPISTDAEWPDAARGVLKDFKVVICHECAHELCRLVPWINRLINPLRSHAHAAWRRMPDGGTEPVDWTGHEGWDLPHARS